MTSTAPVVDAAEERRAWKAFAVASASIFMWVLDAGLLSVALPEIEAAFPGTSRATITWVGTGYLVAVAGLMLVAGRLGDVYGRKRIFQLGLLILGCSSIVTGLAPNIGLVIVARMVQGMGGALVTVTSLTLVLGDLPKDRRPFAIGIWGSAGSVAAVLGPTLGAEILDASSWRFVVSLIAPICFATYFAGRSLLREATDPDAPSRLDPASVVLATAGIGSVALGLSQSRQWGWTDGRAVLAVGLGMAAVTAFVLRSSRHDEPILALRLFRHRSFSLATGAAGLQQLGFFSWFFSTSFVLREIWDWSVRDTGQAISLAFICSAVTGWISGKAAARIGYFWPTAIGALVAGAGPLYWLFAFDSNPSFWAVYLPGAVLFGSGGGACGVLTTGIALSPISAADQGMAYAAHQTVKRMSATIGLALMATLLGEAAGTNLLGGARNVWAMITAAHITMIIPLIGTPRRRVDATAS